MDKYSRRAQRRRNRRACGDQGNHAPFVGMVFLLVGGLLVARAMGLLVPDFVLSWQMLLIVIGVLSGFASRFRNIGFVFPIAIGSFFLLREYFPEFFPKEFLLPAVFILVGAFLVFKPRGRRAAWVKDGDEPPAAALGETATTAAPPPSQGNSNLFSTEPMHSIVADRLQETAVFGGISKTLISKNFAGGEVSAVFGSAEINLLQADMLQDARLELNAVFGSVRLVVPAHWQVKMETTAVLGGIEDKRSKHAIYSDKVLVVEGNAVFGGIQIESH